MAHASNDVELIVAEDDDEDFFLIERALRQARFSGPIHRAVDGEELLEYLGRKSPTGSLSRRVVLLDLNMPRVDGREALRRLKEDEVMRKLPVVVLTTSQSEREADRCYALGANSFVTKPTDYRRLVEAMTLLSKYWLDFVELPSMR